MPTLLSITELGGIPDYSDLYQMSGYQVTQVRSMRAALAHIKKQQPNVIAAQFIYSPTYGSQLSNFEALFAAIQCQSPTSKLIAFVNKENLQHLHQVATRGEVLCIFTYPVNTTKLLECLNRCNES